MSGLAFVLASMLLVLFMITIFIQPIWSIVDCASTPHRSRLSKGLWSLAILITWFVGSFTYGCCAAQSSGLRRLTLCGLSVLVALIITWGTVILTNPDLLRVLGEIGVTRSGP